MPIGAGLLLDRTEPVHGAQPPEILPHDRARISDSGARSEQHLLGTTQPLRDTTT